MNIRSSICTGVPLTAMLALLTSCATTPVPPDPYLPGAEAGQTNWVEPVSDAGLPVSLQWWQQHGDEALAHLLATALEGNYSIAQAQARLRQAAAVQAQARSVRWPTVVAGRSYTWTEQSINSPIGGSSLINAGLVDRELEFWGASLDASWDADLFGANRKRALAAGVMTQAAQVATDASRIAVQGAVASAYFGYRGTHRQYVLLNESINKQAEALSLIKKRQSIGLESTLNVNRAAGQLAASRSGLPLLHAQMRALFHQLAMLTVMPPAQLQELLDDATAQPAMHEVMDFAAGIKTDLLRRRPDIAISEFAMHAAAFEVGAAKADMLPKLVLSARVGFESASLDDLFNGASRTSGVVPGLTTPLFNRGRLKAQSAAALARYDEAVAAFQQTVLNAIGETETRLAELDALRQASAQSVVAYQQDDAAAERAKKLYDRGLLSYLELLDSQRQVLRSQASMVSNDVALQQAQVALFVALGGGWERGDTPTGE